MNKENNILEFRNFLEENKKQLKEHEEAIRKDGYTQVQKKRYSFKLSAQGDLYYDLCNSAPMIWLDEEDIKYFVDKYLPKLKDEMNSKIEEILKDYE